MTCDPSVCFLITRPDWAEFDTGTNHSCASLCVCGLCVCVFRCAQMLQDIRSGIVLDSDSVLTFNINVFLCAAAPSVLSDLFIYLFMFMLKRLLFYFSLVQAGFNISDGP